MERSCLIGLCNLANVSKKVIENAIKRGSGLSTSNSEDKSEVAVYEAMGPGGTAFIM